jgi:membrane protein required for beta-lactamase induction
MFQFIRKNLIDILVLCLVIVNLFTGHKDNVLQNIFYLLFVVWIVAFCIRLYLTVKLNSMKKKKPV